MMRARRKMLDFVLSEHRVYSVSPPPAQEAHQSTREEQSNHHEHEDHSSPGLPAVTQKSVSPLVLVVVRIVNPACEQVFTVRASAVEQVIRDNLVAVLFAVQGRASHALELDVQELYSILAGVWVKPSRLKTYDCTSEVEYRSEPINRETNDSVQELEPDRCDTDKGGQNRDTADESAIAQAGRQFTPVVAANECDAEA